MIERDERLRNLYDPTDTLTSLEEALLRRKDAVTPETAGLSIPPLDSENEIVAAEAAHLGVELHEEHLRTLGLTSLRALDVLTAVESEVERDVLSVLEAVEQLKRQRPFAARHSDLLLAGMIAAEWAHLDVKRKNGQDYYTHPAHVAGILESAWNMSRQPEQNDQRLQRLLFVAYNHDAFEDSLPPDHESFLSTDSLLVSPLFVRTLFEKLNREDGEEAVESLLALTKMRQGDEKTPLATYVPKLLKDPDARLVKLADTQHNHRLDPKGLTDVEAHAIAKNLKRASDYADLQLNILGSLEEGSAHDRWMGHYITAMRPDTYRHSENSSVYVRPLQILGRPAYSRRRTLTEAPAAQQE